MIETKMAGPSPITIISVQYFELGWKEYDEKNKADFFEGFCPVHHVALLPCELCEADDDQDLPVKGTPACPNCRADMDPPGMHWRGKMTNGQMWIGPIA